MDYVKPPLVEIFAEFFLSPDALSAENLVDFGVKLKEAGLAKIELGQQVQIDLGDGQVPRISPKLKCWNEDKTRLVQLAPGLVAVNLVSKDAYPGWEEFLAFIQKAIEATIAKIAVPGLKSISLNTLDRFHFPGTDFLLEKYINVGGPVVPGWYRGAREACDLDLGWGLLEKDGFNRQVHLKVRPGEPTTDVYVDATFHVKCESRDLISGVLETLHNQSRQSFEDLLTEHTRKAIMGGHK